MGPAQLAEVLRRLPLQTHPDLLVGFDTRDDAGVIRVPGQPGLALVQTIDFFTPVVDDPYSYGAIAAANALSDVYAMGGRPLTVMNIACFDPEAAPAETWAQILVGMADKCAEAGAVVVGGHSIEDREPKFGLSVTGIVEEGKVFANTAARPGDRLFLSKPLGTGIASTAAKFDKASADEIAAATASMARLNREAMEFAQVAGVQCATDVTGFGLVGHLLNIARGSGMRVVVQASKLPILPGVERMVAENCLTGGSRRNREAAGGMFVCKSGVPGWLVEAAVDPQTSGGLACCSQTEIQGSTEIGWIEPGEPGLVLLP